MNKLILIITVYTIITIIFAINTFILNKDKFSKEIIINKILTLLLLCSCILYLIFYNLFFYIQIGIFLSISILIFLIVFNKELLSNNEEIDFKELMLPLFFLCLFWPQIVSFLIINSESLINSD